MSISLNHMFVIIPLLLFFLRVVYVDLHPQLEGFAFVAAMTVSAIVAVSTLSIAVFAIDVMYF